MSAGAWAFEARGVTKSYGEQPALSPTDLTVAAGERVVLVGHNGSGKTTLLRIAAGLLDASAGEIRIDGHIAGSEAARRSMSYLGDTPTFYDDLSVREHLEYVAGLHGVTDWSARGEELLRRVGLLDRADDLPTRFSRGMRQKTAIALAFIRPFDVLLVDEPFVGLDEPGRRTLIALIEDAHREGATTIVATHELTYAAAAPRVVALREGRLLYDGVPSGADLSALVG